MRKGGEGGGKRMEGGRVRKEGEGRREGRGGEREGRREEGEGKERTPSGHVWCCLQVIMREAHMAGSEGRESCVDKGCIHQ